jgi:hypothetical protein
MLRALVYAPGPMGEGKQPWYQGCFPVGRGRVVHEPTYVDLRLAVLVAASVEPDNGHGVGHDQEQRNGANTPFPGKVSASRFAEETGTSDRSISKGQRAMAMALLYAPDGRWSYGKRTEIASSRDGSPSDARLSMAAFV